MAHGAPQAATRIVIHGTGRMGRSVCQAGAARGGLVIEALVGPQRPDWLTPESQAPAWYAALADLPSRPALVIDFTLPEGTRTAADWCARQEVPLVSGVTGLPADVMTALQQAAASAPVLWAPNLSIGVNLLAELAGRTAAVVDARVPVTIEDIHHQWKKDAPSGTALMLGAAIAARRGGDDGAIAYRSQREGEVIGEHRVRFHLEGETIELGHAAGDRGIFARGALEAGLWLLRQAPGFYSAADWLADR